MNIAVSILQKVLINYFYKINAGFFLFLFFVLFGIPYNVAGFHIALATLIVQQPLLLLIVMSVWLLYNLKCVDYVAKQLKHPQQQFLFCLYNISFKKCFLLLNYVQVMVYLPVLAYSVFILVLAAKMQYYRCFAEIILFNLIIIFSTAFLYTKVLYRTIHGIKLNVFRNLSIKLPKPLFAILLFHIWHGRKQMLFITKFFSLSVLLLFIKLYEPDHYDIRPLLLCFMLAVAANASVVFEIKNFEDVYLQLYKNFPLTVVKRFLLVLLMFTVLLLPELLIIWKGYPLHFHVKDYVQVAMMGISLLLMFYAVLFTDNIIMDSYIKIVFGIVIGCFFVVLYNPGILLPLLILIIAFGLYNSYYYAFEKQD